MIPPEVVVMSMSMLSSILSIASSTKKLMGDRKISSEEAVKEFENNASKSDRQLLSDAQVRSSILSVLEIKVISEKLLSQMAREAQRCEDNHVESREKASSDTDREQADIRAAQCMCKVLRDIRRYNNKTLPVGGDVFKNWWISYGCVE